MSPSCVELNGCQIYIRSVKIILVCAYVAPNTTRELFVDYIDCLNSLLNTHPDDLILLLGDFNLPKIDWSKPKLVNNTKEGDLVNFCLKNGLQQVNTFCTKLNSLLDLVIVNDVFMVSNITCDIPFGTSDHDSLLIDICVCHSELLDITNQSMPITNTVSDYVNCVNTYNWKWADWNGFAEYCTNVDWSENLPNYASANELWLSFSSTLCHGRDLFVPCIKNKNNSRVIKKTKKGVVKAGKVKHPKNIAKLMRRKKSLWKAAKKSSLGSIKKRKLYKNCTKLLKRTKTSNTLQHEKNVIMKNSTGLIYRHINSRLNHKSGIAPLIDVSGKLVTDNNKKSELLNNHFVNVGTIDDGILPALDMVQHEGLDSIYFSENRVKEIISRLKTNSAAGPDGLAPIIFKKLKHILAVHLALLFTKIVTTGSLPDEWKKAFVTPVFKKGKTSDPNNYRPISLTCVCCKIFESIVKDQLLSYLMAHSLISKDQHGFLKKHSTTTNLIESLNNWTMSLEKKEQIMVIYIDFEKAFDKVSIPKLLHKLQHLGLSGLLLKCLESFLNDRFQAVRIQGAQSHFQKVKSGVPQGSVLGPFLFLLFINDLPNTFDPTFKDKLFADDLKLYKNIDNTSSVVDFQLALNHLYDWCKRWQLGLSVSKCGSVLIGGSKSTDVKYDLFINDTPLSTFSSTKDLGVMIDSRLNFNEHIDTMVSGAKSRCFLLLKSFICRDIDIMIFAFKVYVLPLLEYCSSIWCPSKLTDIDRIEKVQRSFTKKLTGLSNLTYKERLVLCKLPSLELRRLWNDLTLCFKIVHNQIAITFTDFFEYDKNPHGTRGNKFKLKIPFARSTIRKNFFAVRVVPPWNSLPDEVVSLTDVSVFKTKLHLVNLDAFLARR